MAMAARKINTEPCMPERTILDEKVDHLKEDVAGIKADVKRIDAKVDALSASLTEHRLETERSFAKVREEIGALRNDTTSASGELRSDMATAYGELRLEMKTYFEKHSHDRRAMIAWMVSTMIAASGAAFTAAKFFSGP